MVVDVKGPIVADSADMLLKLAIAGAGIVRLGDIIVARAIQQGLLEPLLQDSEVPMGFPFWALMPPGRQRASQGFLGLPGRALRYSTMAQAQWVLTGASCRLMHSRAMPRSITSMAEIEGTGDQRRGSITHRFLDCRRTEPDSPK